MKTIIITRVLILILSASWLTDFEQARLEAKEKNKVILLNFSGSDWCAPCIQLKKGVFEKEEFLSYATEHLVLLRADFPRTKKNQLDPKQKAHNEKLAEKYNPQGKFPFTLLLDADGNVLKTWDGYQHETPEEFTRQFDQVIHGL